MNASSISHSPVSLQASSRCAKLGHRSSGQLSAVNLTSFSCKLGSSKYYPREGWLVRLGTIKTFLPSRNAPCSSCAGHFFIYRFGFGLDFFLPFFRAAAAAFLPAAVYG